MKDYSLAHFIMRELYVFYANKLDMPLNESEKAEYKQKIFEITNDEHDMDEDEVYNRIMTKWSKELKEIGKVKEKANG